MDYHCHSPNTTAAATTNRSNSTTTTTSNKNNSNSFSITPAIHRAVFVNNKGTKLVRQCQYDAAVKSFTEVLKILKPLAAIVEGTNKKEIKDDDDDDDDDCITDAHRVANSNNNNNDNGDDVPMSISFANTAAISSSNINSIYDDELSSRHTDPAAIEPRHQHNGLSPRPSSSSSSSASSSSSSRKKQRTLSAAATAKLLAASSSPSCSSSATSSSSSARRNISHFVFKDPVEIPPESVPQMILVSTNKDTATCASSSELFSKLLMIVMYNLALTLHLHALSLSSSSGNNDKKTKKLFFRARKLYELAFEMHLDESCDVNLLFTLALINNLGLIYNVIGETQRSRTCFKNMFSTMMYLLDSNESQSVKEWDGLLSNVMDILFEQHREIAAPAA